MSLKIEDTLTKNKKKSKNQKGVTRLDKNPKTLLESFLNYGDKKKLFLKKRS